ncbi:MAG: hypothetical protein ACRCW2_12495 [Cellulosilyticaceae bacterium]
MNELNRLVNIWDVVTKGGIKDGASIESWEKLLNTVKAKEEGLIKDAPQEVRDRYGLLLDKMTIEVDRQKAIVAPMTYEVQEQVFNQTFQQFFEKVKQLEGDEFVFIFSGTAHIQKVKGNRPIRLALEFQSKGIPVLYSYWRWSVREECPAYEGGILYELPIDYAMKYMMEIIKAPIPQKYKTFIFEFPYPLASKYLEIFKFYGWKVIYDIRDDWEEFHKVAQAKWYQKAHEIYAIECADCVVAVSKRLTEKFINDTDKDIILLPNALDPSFGGQQIRQKRTKIGYVGHLTASWFDWDALVTIARALPHYTFEIIGHSMPGQVMSIPSNLVHLGPKTFEEVQTYAQNWKIGIIPFKINLLTRAVDPIKVYEYLSMGLKVVSFDMPQITYYPEVKLARTIDEFVEHIEESMEESFDLESVSRFLEQNTWEKRIEWIRRWRKS